MPRPAYIMFSRSGSVDQFKNRLSCFEAVETVDVFKNTPEEIQQTLSGKSRRARDKFWLVSTWMKDEGDTAEAVFEFQLTCIGPDGNNFIEGEVVKFSFPPDISFHRITVPELEIPGYPVVGLYTFHAKLRRDGEQEWIAEQQYPFIVRQLEAPPPPLIVSTSPLA